MRVYKTKKGFIIRSMGDEYVIVAVGEAGKAFRGFIRTNETGAFYWHELEKGITKEDLVRKTLAEYSNLDEATAGQDVSEFLEQMAVALE